MSEAQVDREVSAKQQPTASQSSNSSTSSPSPTNSISIIKLDELSSFGATKQGRLPTLIKLNSQEENRQPHSMPAMEGQQIETTQSPPAEKQQSSLPVELKLPGDNKNSNTAVLAADKENLNESEDFQMVDMVSSDLLGPSLPQPSNLEKPVQKELTGESLEHQRNVLASIQQSIQYPSQLGDSLIEMIINLRNENQSLVRALETNNDYVKERIDEFKRYNEEAKKREAKFALEKADQEHQVRKLQRQNLVLSERLKSMESKLKDMKLEVGETLVAAHSSKNSSLRDGEPTTSNLYPNLMDGDSFSNSALNQAGTTMQMDATSGELYVNNDAGVIDNSPAGAPPMDTEPKSSNLAANEASGSGESATAARVAAMSKEELSKHFDAEKVDFYALDDPMKQCDKLEQQLNDIGKRDYEICLLQQQLNIYRQDYRLERMANLDAKIQIERLKSDIDRLCYERLVEKNATAATAVGEENHGKSHHNHHHHHLHRGSHHRSSGGVRFSEPVAAAADAVMSKLGHQLSKKAARSAAKAAKYASKQAYKEEKRIASAAAAAAAMAASSARASGETATSSNDQQQQQQYQHGHRRHHSHGRPRGIGSEVVSDLLSTANKAMLTGYKMASTQVNLALDKLSAYEQQQAANLAANRPPQQQQQQQSQAHQPPKASAPPAALSSLD